ncbi:hypothetical protein APA_1230 [Pseudanabaena sp. lw0831]|nr:hypothetical protein APA_1230 [Pseudanabaena sp. lw0831]
MVLKLLDLVNPNQNPKSLRLREAPPQAFWVLQQLSIKPTTKRVAGRSPAMGFIVADLKANCCIC